MACFERRKSREIRVGNLKIGGNAPISIQSMTNTDTYDHNATYKQVKALEEALGFEIRFDKCLNDATAITALRERVNALIKENIAKK